MDQKIAVAFPASRTANAVDAYFDIPYPQLINHPPAHLNHLGVKVASAGCIYLNRRDILLRDFISVDGRSDIAFNHRDPELVPQPVDGSHNQAGLA